LAADCTTYGLPSELLNFSWRSIGFCDFVGRGSGIRLLAHSFAVARGHSFSLDHTGIPITYSDVEPNPPL